MSTLGEFLACIQQVETIPCPAAEEWADLINRISIPGRIVEVSEDTYWYFLEVLPPKHMRCSMFAFAEGGEPIRLFWRKDQKHFCQQLTDDETQTFCRLADSRPFVGGSMLYSLSFAPEFFWGTVPIEKLKPSPRPTSVYQAVLSLPHDRWAELARDVFHCDPDNLDVETVIQKIEETNVCTNLDPPVRVHIDPDGWFSVLVYEERP